MRLEFEQQKALQEKILGILAKYLNLKDFRVFFFGSRVAGKGDQRSDIDIGLEGKSKVSADILEAIKEDISNLPVLYKMDLVDFSTADDAFKQIASQNIEQFYP
ncbi:MAG: nucleotidyltransferase domain-containing protein [Candidatus Omnitrophica bacterium]|nr:nucleotidyltransferase domain-containing protein [Candidatus Omnitrophota bacterium]